MIFSKKNLSLKILIGASKESKTMT